MKVAVLIYGEPRHIFIGHNFFVKFFKDIDVDYYFHLWGESNDQKLIEKLYSPKKIIVEKQIINIGKFFKSDFDLSHTNKNLETTLSPLLSIYKVGRLLEENNQEYDLVVLTRTDIAADGIPFTKLFKRSINPNYAYVNYMPGEFWKLSRNQKKNINLKGIDLKFIASNQNSMLELTKIFQNLEKLINEDLVYLCHHRLFYFVLSKSVKKFKFLKLHNKNDSFGWHIIRGDSQNYYFEPERVN